MFSDVGPLELVTLAVLAVLLFGPDRLPEIIQNVAGFLRKVREFSESAKQEIRSELGPEFKDFEFEDLNPRTFVRKHVLESDDDGDGLGLDEIRSALDPRAELSQVADAVREAADEARDDAATPERVSLTKEAGTGSPAHAAVDHDAT
ncbi:sec-independent translocase [Streptomyces sp. Li-HN-5-11]|uniref:sec-independent translocase n=1 Tax=Streptomyces sp. Li-HN-5-11 TaxID=3075432 RepID=UPI0028B163C5|nr:sec-independent translocase [Streptomyces sp. Li-HN-5-11]WNM32817.1 sec-independent translocase [Streptomyces sp. Li-HN-5-11]